MKRLFLFLCVLLGVLVVLAILAVQASIGQEQPAISFLGISSGTLVTDISSLSFRNRFSVEETKLIGLVSFLRVRDGTDVQAQWFSPDDRNPPLGVSHIEMASGATIARFSLASASPWKKGPYMLQVHVTTQGRKKQKFTTSGALHFFIGLSDEEIASYEEGYRSWKEQQ